MFCYQLIPSFPYKKCKIEAGLMMTSQMVAHLITVENSWLKRALSCPECTALLYRELVVVDCLL